MSRLQPAPSHLVESTGIDWRLQLPESHRRPLRAWLWSVAGATMIVLMVGGITRLTDSGLSMVEWQPLLGVVPPVTETQWEQRFDQYKQFPEYRHVRRGMTLAEFKVIYFWEYLHRMAARAIGLVFAVPFGIFWLRGYLSRPLALRALLLFGLGGLQGVMGWLMVSSGLIDRPSVSHYRLAAHLSLALLIFGYSIWLALDLRLGRTRLRVPASARRRMGRAAGVTGALLGLQIVWGALVAGLDAGRFFNTFPLMEGRVLPPGLLDAGAPALLTDPAAVQWMHRVLGTLLLAAAVISFRAVRLPGADPSSRRLGALLLGMISAQVVLGILTLLFLVPVGLGVAHQALATAILGVWLAWLHHVTHLAPTA
ncbi:MAG TPA: COX15/CtaA family protein [Methylomirabilota bacterium]